MTIGLHSNTHLGCWYRGEALTLPELIRTAKQFSAIEKWLCLLLAGALNLAGAKIVPRSRGLGDSFVKQSTRIVMFIAAFAFLLAAPPAWAVDTNSTVRPGGFQFDGKISRQILYEQR
jgi:hypothetical protein